MKIAGPLLEAVLRRRLNRFTVEAELEGRTVLAYLRNSGRLPYLLVPGKRLLLRRLEKSPQRRTEFDLVFVKQGRELVSVDATLPNQLIAEAITAGQIRQLTRYHVKKAEVTFENSRFDLLLNKGHQRFLLEVKSVTLVEDNTAMFPDSPTTRGKRHISELIRLGRNGLGAGVLFAVMHGKAERFLPNWNMDPDFAETLSLAARKGVLVCAYRFKTTRSEISVNKELPVEGL